MNILNTALVGVIVFTTMLRITYILLFLYAASVSGASVNGSSISRPISSSRSVDDVMSQWGPHIMDFLELIDMSKLLTVAMPYLNDPEVINFIQFITNGEFVELIQEFESMEEFAEAISYLESKGYHVELIINAIHSYLDIPPIEKPNVQFRNKQGMLGFIEDILAVLPREEFKELFESKLEDSPEVAQLLETINSEEFIDILRRMSQNPKFKKTMSILESYGFQPEYICALAKEIFGDYYLGIFCE